MLTKLDNPAVIKFQKIYKTLSWRRPFVEIHIYPKMNSALKWIPHASAQFQWYLSKLWGKHCFMLELNFINFWSFWHIFWQYFINFEAFEYFETKFHKFPKLLTYFVQKCTSRIAQSRTLLILYFFNILRIFSSYFVLVLFIFLHHVFTSYS